MITLDKIDILAHHEGKVEWEIAEDARKLYSALKTHANGEVPKEIISERRPNEPDEIKNYRYKIYAPKTEHPISKVTTSLSKIRRSPDWKVDYSKSEIPAFLEGKSIKDYLEDEFPIYDNIDSWLFDEALQNVLIDANAICSIVPLKFNVEPNEFIKPVPFIANVNEVVYYEESEYVIYETDRDIKVVVDGVKREFDIYVLSTRNEIIEYYILEAKDAKIVTEIHRYTHGLNELQAFRFRGLFYKNEDGDVIWKSPINSMVVHLNEAARIYSDQQAEYVLHMHSEKWTINTNTCKKCNGTGNTRVGLSMTNSSCGSCNGTGFEVVSPFRNHSINVDLHKPNSQIPPIPPAGYVQKSIEIAKILDEQVTKNLYQALESVNMQFLFNVPIDQSGIAKQWDRDETDNFAHKVASILKYVRENVAYYVNNLRYSLIIPDAETREKQLPTVSIPQKFDLVNNALLIEEYKQAKDANMSPIILASMEMEISLKRFSHDSDVSTFTKLVYKLDPLYSITEDDKIMRLSNKGITESDYIISSNIQKFVRKALTENENFDELEYLEQVKIMDGYAKEVMNTNSNEQALLPPVA